MSMAGNVGNITSPFMAACLEIEQKTILLCPLQWPVDPLIVFDAWLVMTSATVEWWSKR